MFSLCKYRDYSVINKEFSVFLLTFLMLIMEHTVKQRLITFIKHKGLSQAKFEKAIGVSNGFVNNISKGIGADKLQRIINVFPEVNTDWLITGVGDMLVEASLKSKAPTSKAAKRKMLDGIIFNPSRLVTGAVAPACVPRVKESTESDANLKVIKAQEKTIATQERLISVLQAEVERLQRALEEKNNG